MKSLISSLMFTFTLLVSIVTFPVIFIIQSWNKGYRYVLELTGLMLKFFFYSFTSNSSNIMVLISTQLIIFQTSPFLAFCITTALSLCSVAIVAIFSNEKPSYYMRQLLHKSGLWNIVESLKFLEIDLLGCQPIRGVVFSAYGYFTSERPNGSFKIHEWDTSEWGYTLFRDAEEFEKNAIDPDLLNLGLDLTERILEIETSNSPTDWIFKYKRFINVKTETYMDFVGVPDTVRIKKYCELYVLNKPTGIKHSYEEFQILTKTYIDSDQLKESSREWLNGHSITALIEKVICLMYKDWIIIDGSVRQDFCHAKSLEESIPLFLDSMLLNGCDLYRTVGWRTFAGLSSAYHTTKNSLPNMSILAYHNYNFFGYLDLGLLILSCGGIKDNFKFDTTKKKTYKSEVCELSDRGYLPNQTFKCRPYRGRFSNKFNLFLGLLKDFYTGCNLIDKKAFDQHVMDVIGIKPSIVTDRENKCYRLLGRDSLYATPKIANMVNENWENYTVTKKIEPKKIDYGKAFIEVKEISKIKVDIPHVYRPFAVPSFVESLKKSIIEESIDGPSIKEALSVENVAYLSSTEPKPFVMTPEHKLTISTLPKESRKEFVDKLKEDSQRVHKYFGLNTHARTVLIYPYKIELRIEFAEKAMYRGIMSTEKNQLRYECKILDFIKQQNRLLNLQYKQSKKHASTSPKSKRVRFGRAAKSIIACALIHDDNSNKIIKANKCNRVNGTVLSDLSITRSILKSKISKVNHEKVSGSELDPPNLFMKDYLKFLKEMLSEQLGIPEEIQRLEREIKEVHGEKSYLLI